MRKQINKTTSFPAFIVSFYDCQLYCCAYYSVITDKETRPAVSKAAASLCLVFSYAAILLNTLKINYTSISFIDMLPWFYFLLFR